MSLSTGPIRPYFQNIEISSRSSGRTGVLRLGRGEVSLFNGTRLDYTEPLTKSDWFSMKY